MSDTLLKYQCPTCGGTLQFNADKQLVVCDFCESEFPEDLFQSEPTENIQDKPIDWKLDGVVESHETMEEQKAYTCSSCGAEIISDGVTAATECLYCGNPVVVESNVSGMVKPDMVIPFKIDKEKAEEMLREFYKGKFLLPSAFKNENRIKKIAGMYVPFWLFSCTGRGRVNYSATKVRRWSDSNYNYTNTKHYAIARGGSVGFEKIPVDASKKMEDDYMDGLEPYDYNDLKAFEPMYLAGYFADKYDVSVEECSQRATHRVVNSVVDEFQRTVHGYTTVTKTNADVQMSGEDINYALFPIWMLNTKYNDKMYQFAINGQTGKVSGELPIDKMKRNLLWLAITLVGGFPLAYLIDFFMS